MMSSNSQIGSSSSISLDDLAGHAMMGNWDKVDNIYQTNPTAHTFEVNKAKDTALRLAISARLPDMVQKLVYAAAKTDGALEKPNYWGDTALHLAAFFGDVNMCICIANKNSELIGKRNRELETPFFYAVHFGNIKAFLCLHDKICEIEDGYVYGRRGRDGETILHTAISRQHYEIAYHIIRLYPKFVYSMNEKGFSPLHLLASSPSAFRSGCPQIRGFHQLVYYGIHVSKLKMRRHYEDKEEHEEKHQTSESYISSLRHRITALMDCSTNMHGQQKDEEGQNADRDHREEQRSNRLENTVRSSIRCLTQAMWIIFGPAGKYAPTKLKETKQKNVWSKQIMKDIVKKIAKFRYENNGRSPYPDATADAKKWLDENQQFTITDNATLPVDNSKDENQNKEENKKSKETNGKEKVSETMAQMETPVLDTAKNGVTETVKEVSTTGKAEKVSATVAKVETPILVAAKNGVIEIVKEILETKVGNIYIAIHDLNSENKNVVLLAAENRKANVYDFLLKQKQMKETIFSQRDIKGNSALHLAANLGHHAEPWPVPGPALQMQCEMKWYEFVKSSMGAHFFVWFNTDNKTPDDIFKETHRDLVKDGGEWLNKTSESFSIVGTLIATVAFATSAIVPGGVDDKTGSPVLEKKPAFSIFAISSLIALCFSIMCVIMFLSILTSRYQDVDFGRDLPRKFLIGLTSLFVSITSMLASFCAGHSFVIKEELKYAALPVYAITCLVVTIITVAQFPFFFDLVMISFTKKPWSHKN